MIKIKAEPSVVDRLHVLKSRVRVWVETNMIKYFGKWVRSGVTLEVFTFYVGESGRYYVRQANDPKDWSTLSGPTTYLIMPTNIDGHVVTWTSWVLVNWSGNTIYKCLSRGKRSAIDNLKNEIGLGHLSKCESPEFAIWSDIPGDSPSTYQAEAEL